MVKVTKVPTPVVSHRKYPEIGRGGLRWRLGLINEDIGSGLQEVRSCLFVLRFILVRRTKFGCRGGRP